MSHYSLDPYDRCGPDCVAEAPILDTADGNEHQECPEFEATECVVCGLSEGAAKHLANFLPYWHAFQAP